MYTKKQLMLCMAAIAILSFSLTNCNGTGKKDHQEEKPEIIAPSQIVQIDQAKSMYDNYTARRVPMIQQYEDSINRTKGIMKEGEVAPFDVARFVYYDYETIKQYMKYIEQEAEAANVEISTLRFYYSNYPDEINFPGTKDAIKHPRQNSLMLSPTIKKGKRDHSFYLTSGAQGQEAVIINDDFGAIKGMGLQLTEDNRVNASIAPNFFKSNVKPVYAATSLTLNRSQGAPPYHQ